MGAVLGKNKPLAIGLAKLDRFTGQTQENPQVLGLWEEDEIQDPELRGVENVAAIETGKIVNQDQGPLLTEELYRKLKDEGIELYLRDPESKTEIEVPSSERL